MFREVVRTAIQTSLKIKQVFVSLLSDNWDRIGQILFNSPQCVFFSLTIGASHWVIGGWCCASLFTFNLAWRRHLPVPLLAVIWWSPEAFWLKITQGNWGIETEALTHTDRKHFYTRKSKKVKNKKKGSFKTESTIFFIHPKQPFLFFYRSKSDLNQSEH